MSLPANLKDVANKLNLSITTVSRALDGYHDVSDATRELVSKTANEMEYHPSVTARRLRKQCTDTIGFIIPTYDNHFFDPIFSELLIGIGTEVSSQDMDLLVSTCPPGPEELKVYKRMVIEQRVDGMLVARTRVHDERIAYLTDRGFPFMAFGRSNNATDFNYIDVDGAAGTNEIVQYLIVLGHRRIAIILPREDVMFAQYRLQGFEEAMAEAGLTVDSALMERSTLTMHGGYEAGRTLLLHDDPPSAIIASNDLMALGVLSAAQGLGLIVGTDVSVTGFDDIPLAGYAHPPLTTVRQPLFEIGKRICGMLIRLLQGETFSENQVIIKPKLMIRESCGVVA